MIDKIKALVILLAIAGGILAGSAAPGHSHAAELAYLQSHFEELYRTDYPRFWNILHDAAAEARACHQSATMAEFLKLIDIPQHNAEFQEFFAEEIESMCVRQTQCFRSALQLMDQSSRQRILNVLSEPTFFDKMAVQRALKGITGSPSQNK